MAVRYNPNPARITEPLYKVEELEKSPLYTVLCGGKELTVYHTDSFDYVIPVVDDDSPLSFQVKVSKDFQKAVFRPAKTNVQAQISGRELSFRLEKPSKVTLELDGNLKTPLLEEGSVVCGCVNALFAHGMRILGNGILNGCVWHPKEENGGGRPMIRMVFCDDVKIQGITMVDGGSWHLVPGACRNVEIEDVNIMSRVCTGDGIDIVGCEDVTMRNSFIRASDDCVCIKAASYPDPAANRDVKNILVEHCVLWNAEPGNAVEIGYEVRCDEISDITFRDLDIVHCEYEGNQSGGVLTIHNADRAHIHDIVYEDIRVEDAQEKFVDIKVLDSKYSLDRKRGSVENIYFRNVEILNGNFPVSIIRGFEMHTEMSRPRNIYFDNVVVLGKQVESPSDLHMVVELSDDILFNGTAHAKRNPF